MSRSKDAASKSGSLQTAGVWNEGKSMKRPSRRSIHANCSCVSCRAATPAPVSIFFLALQCVYLDGITICLLPYPYPPLFYREGRVVSGHHTYTLVYRLRNTVTQSCWSRGGKNWNRWWDLALDAGAEQALLLPLLWKWERHSGGVTVELC